MDCCSDRPLVMADIATALPPLDPSTFIPGFLANLGFVVDKVAERINLHLGAVITPLGLTHRQYGLLLLLQDDGPQSQIVLSQRVGLDRTSVMRTVDLLEARGFVRRNPVPADRHKHSVALTDAGDKLLTGTLAEVRQAERDFAAVLSEQEQAQLLVATQTAAQSR